MEARRAHEAARRPTLSRAVLRSELIVVMAIFPLVAVVTALVDLSREVSVGRGVTASIPLLSPGHTVLSTVTLVALEAAETAPIVLVWYLLSRSEESFETLGLSRSELRRVGWAALLLVITFVTGSVSVALHRFAPSWSFGSGTSYGALPWLLFAGALATSAKAGLVEEIFVNGYLLHRLDQLGWRRGRSLLTSAAVRTSYHLYYGVAGLAVLPLGLVYGWFWQRKRSLWPVIFAHITYDAILFAVAIQASR